jgi:hypothetical protein
MSCARSKGRSALCSASAGAFPGARARDHFCRCPRAADRRAGERAARRPRGQNKHGVRERAERQAPRAGAGRGCTHHVKRPPQHGRLHDEYKEPPYQLRAHDRVQQPLALLVVGCFRALPRGRARCCLLAMGLRYRAARRRPRLGAGPSTTGRAGPTACPACTGPALAVALEPAARHWPLQGAHPGCRAAMSPVAATIPCPRGACRGRGAALRRQPARPGRLRHCGRSPRPPTMSPTTTAVPYTHTRIRWCCWLSLHQACLYRLKTSSLTRNGPTRRPHKAAAQQAA